jgi:hypothetical protein
MPLSTVELAEAKEAATALLDDLGLTAYLFEVEPRAERWEVRVECALDSGWQTVDFDVASERLLACRRNAAVHAALLDEWRERLAACKKNSP